MTNFDLKDKLENLQNLINHSDSLLDYCSEKKTKPYFTNALINEINLCIKNIDSLKEEVKKGNLTKEMAKIDMGYWMNESNWCTAKKLFEATNYAEGETAHQKLRDALTKLQEELAGLHKIILNAPAECYQNFYETCREDIGAKLAEDHFEVFKASCHMYKEDLLRSLQHYKQYVIYEFFKRNFLRYDHCPLYNPHGRKFSFDFDLLPNEAEDNEKTRNFCLCLNRYLIILDNNTIYLNKELLGKYLFDNYLHITDFDRIGVFYIEKAFEQYNQGMKEVRSQAAEQNNVKETNILEQPAAEELSYFAPQKNLQTLLCRSWFLEVRTKETYNQAWTDAFVEALMASEWRDDIARQWAITGQRSKVKQIKGYVLGLLTDACVLRGSYNQVAMKAGVTDDPRSFSRYMAEGKKQPYAQWVMRYITEH